MKARQGLRSCLFFLMVALFVARDASAQALVLVDSVDYLSNIEATDRSTYPSSHPSTELSPGVAVPAVYVRGTEPDAKIYFQEFFGQSFSATLHITAARYKTLNNQTHTVTVSPSSQTVNLTGYPNLDDADISISGIPDEVSGGTLEVIAYMTLDHPVTIFWTTYPTGHVCWGNTTTYVPIGEFLFTDDTPSGVQEVPWTDLLTIASAWAEGEVGIYDVMLEIVTGLYWTANFYYVPGQNIYFDYTYETASGVIDLSQVIDDFYTPSEFSMNCLDTAAIVAVLGRAQGHDFETKHLKYYNSEFMTNPVCAMGKNATSWKDSDPNYVQEEFDFHQVAECGGKIFDVSSAHWTSPYGGSYKNPPCDWSLTYYWQTTGIWTSPDVENYNQEYYPGPLRNYWERSGLTYGLSMTVQSAVSLTSHTTLVIGVY